MLKKLLCTMLALALLTPCLLAASAAAAPNCLIPFMFYSTYNNALQTVINDGFSNASESEKQDYIDQLQISYTENIDTVMYYNNSDWTLETSFYFSDGVPSFGGSATTLNFVINTADSDSRAIAQDAFLLALTKLVDGVDGNALFNWARSNPDLNNSFALGSYRLMSVPTDTYLHYAILSTDGAVDPQEENRTSGGATGTPDSLPFMLLEEQGYAVELTSLALMEYASDDVSLRFNIRIYNTGGYKLNLFVNDTELNGTPCKMWGSMYDEKNPQEYDTFLFVNSDKSTSLASTLRNAKTIRFTLCAKDDNNYNVVFEQPVTLDLSRLPIEVH